MPIKNFKVKYKERAVIQRAYERAIQKYGLVDTFSMKDSVRISAESRMTLNGIYIGVNALFYLRFHDSFESEGFSTKNGVNPVPITQTVFQDPKVQNALSKIVGEYIEWRIQNYPIFENAFDLKDPAIFVGFNLFGDGGKWNKDIPFRKLTR